MTYKFEKDPVNGLILVYIVLDKIYDFKMMLDTGASNTTFDVNPLYIAKYPIINIHETGTVETASGYMEVDIMQTKVISAFGHTVYDMKVQVYDYLKHGILSDYDGVLGLDFFEDTEFTVNMKNHTLHNTAPPHQQNAQYRCQEEDPGSDYSTHSTCPRRNF